MSWSLAASGQVNKVIPSIKEQVTKYKFTDATEQEVFEQSANLIVKTLESFDQERYVEVSASGHIGFKEYTNKTSPYQSVTLTIRPLNFTV